ncbi:MAG: type II toxin-antitoxin system RelE family toxin [Candidatus Anammoxibacter sp.]
MNYHILIERKARKEAQNVSSPEIVKIDKAILSLSVNPRPNNCKKLTGKEGFRIRVGNYRILYKIDDKTKTIIVYRIKIKSKDIYK